MATLLKMALEKIRAECDPKRQKDLHAGFTKALERLGPMLKQQSSASSASSANGSPSTLDADEFWPVLKDACEPSLPVKVRETALDWIQKLLAQHLLTGRRWSQSASSVEAASVDETSSDPPSQSQSQSSDGKSSSLAGSSYPPLQIDDMIHTICLASPLISPAADPHKPHPESPIHLQIIKCLLTASTSPMCHVHETSLLKAVQACANIWLYSGNQVNQMTAKAGLMQICHFVMTRMESFMEEYEQRKSPKEKSPNTLPTPFSNSTNNNGGGLPTLPSFLKTTISKDNNPYEANDDLMADLLRRDAYFLMRYLCRLSMKVDKPSQQQQPSSLQHQQQVSPQTPTQPGITTLPNVSTPSIEDLSPMALRTRSLALEMILSLLTNAGKMMQQEPFITLIRQYITLAVSKNGLSTVPQLFEFALSVFLTLIKNFKVTLKGEIEILFNEIYLYILENPNALVRQKLMVLQGLYKICANPQVLVDLYLNYDCDMVMNSVYEKIVLALGKLAQGSGTENVRLTIGTGANAKQVGVFGVQVDDPALNDGLALEERKLRSKALRCLTAISVSLTEWMKESSHGNGTSVIAEALLQMAANSGVAVEAERKSVVSPNGTNHTSSSGPPSVSASTETSPVNTSGNKLQSDSETTVGTSTTVDANGDVRRSMPPSTAVLTPPVLLYKNPLHSVSMGDFPTPQPQRMAKPGEGDTAGVLPEVNVPRENPEEYERVKTKKTQLRQGITKFNESPSKGMVFLKEAGFVSDDASVVKFLRNTPELSRTAIGDFIGEGKEYNIKIMHLFVESFDFTSVDFVAALRQFLQTFRLPGEAQKIDRIMESFSARYCTNNPEVFAKADVAYTLAFSIMMLNTDQHSPRIKNRMTVQDFIKNNRGINDNADLPDELLADIFDNISKNEIILEAERTVKELEKMTSVGLSTSSRDLERKRRELFRRETKQAEKKSQNLMKRGKEKNITPFKSATHIDHARPMFDLFWNFAVRAFQTIFEECAADNFPLIDARLPTDVPPSDSNFDIINLCLMGTMNGIKIGCLFHLETERDAFVASLGSMTNLSDIATVKAKNIFAARLLISIGQQYGNNLEESWKHVLKCISEIDRWQLVVERSRNSESQDGNSVRTSPVKDNIDVAPQLLNDIRSFSMRRGSLSKLTKELHSQSASLTIDKIFANSANLDGNSIIHFFRAICLVAEEEVESSRMYLLQKIIEISYYNMGRIRLEWSQIWRVLLGFFNTVGCHQDFSVAEYAVDSLRQMGMKFLERSELAHFHTNNEFLKPLEYIIRHSKYPKIKELVISSLAHMVAARAANIKSGWKSIFVIISRTTGESNDITLVRRSFDLLRSTPENHWELITEYFVDYTTCLVDFTFVDESIGVTHDETSPKIAHVALQLLLDCTQRLSNELKKNPAEIKDGMLTDDIFYLKWFPLLSGLTRVVLGSSNADIRSKALDTFFEILKRHGNLFSFDRKHWKTIIKSVIMPLFEDLREPVNKSMRKEAGEAVNSVIWIHTIRKMIDIYTQFFLPASDKPLGSTESFSSHLILVELLLDLMVLLTARNSDNLAQTGIIYLNQFIQQNVSNMDENAWNVVISAIERIFKMTIPVELLKFPVAVNANGPRHMTDIAAENEAALIASIDVTHAILKCAIHLMVLQFMRDLALESDDEASTLISGVYSSSSGAPVSATIPKTPSANGSTAAPVLSMTIKTYPSKVLLAFNSKQRARFLSCLHASYVFANNFNSNYELRLALWKAEVVKQMPNLIKQETQALSTYLSITFHLFRADVTDHHVDIPRARTQARRSSMEESAEAQLNPPVESADQSQKMCTYLLEPSGLGYRHSTELLTPLLEETVALFERYIQFLTDPQKYQRDITSWSLVIILLWKEILAVPWGLNKSSTDQASTTRPGDNSPLVRFKAQIPNFFRLAIRMMGVDRFEVRVALQSFLERIVTLTDRESFLNEL